MFSKKVRDLTIDDMILGNVVCHNCGKSVSYEGQEPLSIFTCTSCNKGFNFVPMQVDEFWLFAPLGGGGMGAVYKAYIEGEPDKVSAVKVLPRETRNDPILIDGLKLETEIIEKLGANACIVSGMGSGYFEGEYYLASEFVDGERLDKMIQRMGRIPEIDVICIVLRLLQGEAHIYNQGYLFRDMKPENIIVTKDGAVLFDYGICITIEESHFDQGDSVSGSPIYWPPERVIGDIEEANSEIYSTGMVMYHCLNGAPYFHAKEIETMARKHIRTVRLSDKEQKMKNIKDDLADVILKMIAREQEDRYQCFAEVEKDIIKIYLKRINEQIKSKK